MTYRVGQVLFVIVNKKMQVYPMMIIEEIVKRTLQGEEVNYMLQGGSDPTTTILLNQVDGEIFESADEAKYVLTNRATTQIEKLVDAAVARANEWYNTQKQEDRPIIMSLQQPEQETVKVTLPDGTVANLKMG